MKHIFLGSLVANRGEKLFEKNGWGMVTDILYDSARGKSIGYLVHFPMACKVLHCVAEDLKIFENKNVRVKVIAHPLTSIFSD